MEKMTFFGFAADNHVPETTRIPVYMGVQPINLRNIFPLSKRVGFIHFHKQGGNVGKNPIFPVLQVRASVAHKQAW